MKRRLIFVEARGEVVGMKKMTLCLALFTLAGCESVPIAQSPRSYVAGNVATWNFTEAANAAQAHCDSHGRDAEYVPDDRPDGKATWKCVDR